MKKQVALQDRKITYTLRKSKRARRVRLAVYCDGSVIVTAPFDLKENVVERFVLEKIGWLFSKIAYFKQFKGKPVTRYSRADYLKYKEEARALAVDRVAYFNKIYRVKYNKINIKNQKTRWGSCSNKGNLNFNYKILFLPASLADYIVVHEMCHCLEFNHSRRFWSLVAKVMPDYLAIKKELKGNTLNSYR